MNYNRKQLCQLGGVEYTALQSLERRGLNIFNFDMLPDDFSGYDEVAVLEVALAKALADTKVVPGLSLKDGFLTLREFWKCEGTIAPDRGPYFGIGVTGNDSLRAYSGNLDEIVAWEKNAVDDNGRSPAKRVYLINVEQVLSEIVERAKQFDIPFDPKASFRRS